MKQFKASLIKIKKTLGVLLAAAFLISVSAVPVSAASEISLNIKNGSIEAGKSYQLIATTNSKKAVTWRSSDSATVSVSQTGKIKALKAGSATITASSDGAAASCKITVKASGAVKTDENRTRTDPVRTPVPDLIPYYDIINIYNVSTSRSFSQAYEPFSVTVNHPSAIKQGTASVQLSAEIAYDDGSEFTELTDWTVETFLSDGEAGKGAAINNFTGELTLDKNIPVGSVVNVAYNVRAPYDFSILIQLMIIEDDSKPKNKKALYAKDPRFEIRNGVPGLAWDNPDPLGSTNAYLAGINKNDATSHYANDTLVSYRIGTGGQFWGTAFNLNVNQYIKESIAGKAKEGEVKYYIISFSDFSEVTKDEYGNIETWKKSKLETRLDLDLTEKISFSDKIIEVTGAAYSESSNVLTVKGKFERGKAYFISDIQTGACYSSVAESDSELRVSEAEMTEFLKNIYVIGVDAGFNSKDMVLTLTKEQKTAVKVMEVK